MTIEQTVEIPEHAAESPVVLQLVKDQRPFMELSLPQELPTGKAKVAFTVTAEPAGKETNSISSFDIALAEIRELCKDSKLTVDRFLEMKQEDIALEEAKYQRLFRREGID
jgi:hypothetical protein